MKFYMPEWTDKEITDCHDLIYPGVSLEMPDGVPEGIPKSRVSYFGPVPRFVFSDDKAVSE